jgi:hypothetical protein
MSMEENQTHIHIFLVMLFLVESGYEGLIVIY